MAGSRLPAVNDPLCENTAIQKVNPHILCSPLFGAFGSPSTRLRAYGRITSILANQQTAAAFRLCCDVVINMEDFEPVVGDGFERAAPASVPVQALLAR